MLENAKQVRAAVKKLNKGRDQELVVVTNDKKTVFVGEISAAIGGLHAVTNVRRIGLPGVTTTDSAKSRLRIAAGQDVKKKKLKAAFRAFDKALVPDVGIKISTSHLPTGVIDWEEGSEENLTEVFDRMLG